MKTAALLLTTALLLPPASAFAQSFAFTAAYCQHCSSGGQRWSRPLGTQLAEAFMQRLGAD